MLSVRRCSDNVVGAMPSSESWKSWSALRHGRMKVARMREVLARSNDAYVWATGHSAISCFWMIFFIRLLQLLQLTSIVIVTMMQIVNNQWSSP